VLRQQELPPLDPKLANVRTRDPPGDFDYLSLVGDGFNKLRRYTPALLEALSMKAARPARRVGSRRSNKRHEIFSEIP
jgi:hypothetical protein